MEGLGGLYPRSWGGGLGSGGLSGPGVFGLESLCPRSWGLGSGGPEGPYLSSLVLLTALLRGLGRPDGGSLIIVSVSVVLA